MPEAVQISESVGVQATASDRNKFVRDAHRIIVVDGGELTVASDAITVTPTDGNGEGKYDIDTQSDAATDDLDTISGGSAGDIILLKAENENRITTLKSGGNIIIGDTPLHTEFHQGLFFDGSNWMPAFNREIFMIEHWLLGAAVAPTATEINIAIANFFWSVPPEFHGWYWIGGHASILVAGSTASTFYARKYPGSASFTENNPFTIAASDYDSWDSSEPSPSATYHQISAGDYLFWQCNTVGTNAKGFIGKHFLARSP